MVAKRNVLRPTILRYAVLKCCDSFARVRKYRVNNVAIYVLICCDRLCDHVKQWRLVWEIKGWRVKSEIISRTCYQNFYIINPLTKRKWNYSLISWINHFFLCEGDILREWTRRLSERKSRWNRAKYMRAASCRLRLWRNRNHICGR